MDAPLGAQVIGQGVRRVAKLCERGGVFHNHQAASGIHVLSQQIYFLCGERLGGAGNDNCQGILGDLVLRQQVQRLDRVVLGLQRALCNGHAGLGGVLNIRLTVTGEEVHHPRFGADQPNERPRDLRLVGVGGDLLLVAHREQDLAVAGDASLASRDRIAIRVNELVIELAGAVDLEILQQLGGCRGGCPLGVEADRHDLTRQFAQRLDRLRCERVRLVLGEIHLLRVFVSQDVAKDQDEQDRQGEDQRVRPIARLASGEHAPHAVRVQDHIDRDADQSHAQAHPGGSLPGLHVRHGEHLQPDKAHRDARHRARQERQPGNDQGD